MQEVVAGRREEDGEIRETAREEKPAILMLGTGSRHFVINCCSSYRVEVIYGILVTTAVACVVKVSLHQSVLHCALLQNLPVCFQSSTSTLSIDFFAILLCSGFNSL